uniref:Uncharacterized protein ycf35 n=1 Tax=Rhodymenia pseudopalmata TaxID=31502 RepID=A0A1C9C7P4_RHOPU|nr:hypothetical protein Rhodyp_112 [Rhodymenia pseudopalmata]AOM64390.1 hypothetical protein Rhodyp_112 [Rhodymenia pseudopalmata]
MSHFSRIKTSIKNFDILHKTLKDLRFSCNCLIDKISDANGVVYDIDLAFKTHDSSENILGFSWNGNEYSLVVDLQLWNQEMSIDRFMDKILQQYALNTILNSSSSEGFKAINHQVNQDGSITLMMQRWH